MKTLALLFFTCVVSLTLRAADPAPKAAVIYPEIKLVSGEVLKNATFLSQNPTHVTFKVGNTMRQVDKRQLPTELQQRYPYDEQAAEARKAALAEADAKRAADKEAKKAAPATAPAAGATAATSGPANKYVKNGVRISYQSDPEGSGPIITLVNDSGVDQEFQKTDIAAKMMDDRVSRLRVASRGDRLEDGGKIVVVGDVLTVRAHDRLEFRGYFLSNPKINKHNVADVFWAEPKPPQP